MPRPVLRPFVRRLWVTDGETSSGVETPRERVLPTGEMHVALRASDVPFCFLRGTQDPVGYALGCSMAAGARIAPHFKDVSHPARGVHPAVADALGRFGTGISIGDVVRKTGYSHRRFIDLFRSSVGLTPKMFCRVRRFQRAVVRLSSDSTSVAEVAFNAGYSDQAHLTRDFREFAGITPGEYRRHRTRSPGHVPVGAALGAVGLAFGLLISVLLTGLIESLLFETSLTDPATFAVETLTLFGVALAASYVPARKASRVEPFHALRSD